MTEGWRVVPAINRDVYPLSTDVICNDSTCDVMHVALGLHKRWPSYHNLGQNDDLHPRCLT